MEKDSHAQRNNTKSHESTFKNVKKTDTGSWKLFNKLHRSHFGYPSDVCNPRYLLVMKV